MTLVRPFAYFVSYFPQLFNQSSRGGRELDGQGGLDPVPSGVASQRSSTGTHYGGQLIRRDVGGAQNKQGKGVGGHFHAQRRKRLCAQRRGRVLEIQAVPDFVGNQESIRHNASAALGRNPCMRLDELVEQMAPRFGVVEQIADVADLLVDPRARLEKRRKTWLAQVSADFILRICESHEVLVVPDVHGQELGAKRARPSAKSRH